MVDGWSSIRVSVLVSVLRRELCFGLILSANSNRYCP
jgi:hypothetical protein